MDDVDELRKVAPFINTGPRNRYGWSHFFESKNIVNFLKSKVYTIIRRHLLTGKYVATLDLEIINPY